MRVRGWASGPAGDRGDVDEVTAAIAQLVEEHLGHRDRAEQVDLDHLTQLGALLRRERRQQHHPGVVDQDVGATELGLDARGGRRDRVVVGDIGLDRDRPVAELVGERLDPVGATGQQRQTMTVGGQRSAVASPIPDEAPVKTATRPRF